MVGREESQRQGDQVKLLNILQIRDFMKIAIKMVNCQLKVKTAASRRHSADLRLERDGRNEKTP